MKIVSFQHNGSIGYGLVDSKQIFPASWAFQNLYPTLRDVLHANMLAEFQCDAVTINQPLDLVDVILLPPIPNPGKIICVGINYKKIYPLDITPPVMNYPIIFGKERETLLGHEHPLHIPAGLAANSFDYEGEIAVIIGKSGQNISEKTALSHVAGYTVLNDGSVREWQKHSIHAGKNFAGSGACGPWMVTANEIKNPEKMELTTRLNGEIVQKAKAKEMIFNIATQIAYISSILPLSSGDIIATGSPEGTGGSQKPPRFLKAGDVLDITVSQVGTLTNKVGAG